MAHAFSSDYRRTCIMVWGPGSKHKTAESRHLARKLNAMHVNTEYFYQFMWRKIYPEQFAEIERIPDPSRRFEKKERLYDMTLAHSLGETVCDYSDVMKHSETAFEFMRDALKTIHGISLTRDLWLKYEREEGGGLSKRKTTQFYKDFTLWYAKTQNRNMVIESEGYSFNTDRYRHGFKGANTILNVIHSNRVHIIGQSRKTSPPAHNAYGPSLQLAVESRVFSTIVVTENSVQGSCEWLRFHRKKDGYRCVFQEQGIVMTPMRQKFCRHMFAGQLM